MLFRSDTPALQNRAQAARKSFEAALDDNLNTAEALAAIFDMVREGNTAMDHGQFHDADRGAFLDTLERWDRIFAVLGEDDYAKLVKFGFVQQGASSVNRGADLKNQEANSAVESADSPTAALVMETLRDDMIEKLIAERVVDRRGGDYARSDEIRSDLLKAGVILEDTKAGTRWKRK